MNNNILDPVKDFAAKGNNHITYYEKYLSDKSVGTLDLDKIRKAPVGGKPLKAYEGSTILIFSQSIRSAKIDLLDKSNSNLRKEMVKAVKELGYEALDNSEGIMISAPTITTEIRNKLIIEIKKRKEDVKQSINADRAKANALISDKNSGFSENQQRKLKADVDQEKDSLYKKLEKVFEAKEKEININEQPLKKK